MTRGTLLPNDALPLLQGTSLDAQRLGWKIERLQGKTDSNMTAVILQATCKPGSFTACSLWRFLATHHFLRAKHVVFVGTNDYTYTFFFQVKVADCYWLSDWKIIEAQFISVPSLPCKDVEDLPEMMVFDLDGAHLAAIRFSNLLSIWQVGVS